MRIKPTSVMEGHTMIFFRNRGKNTAACLASMKLKLNGRQ